MGDDGLFGPGSVTWRVHLEPVLWVGGFRALLLQSLHPRVMRGTYQNSALFDPAKARNAGLVYEGVGRAAGRPAPVKV